MDCFPTIGGGLSPSIFLSAMSLESLRSQLLTSLLALDAGLHKEMTLGSPRELQANLLQQTQLSKIPQLTPLPLLPEKGLAVAPSYQIRPTFVFKELEALLQDYVKPGILRHETIGALHAFKEVASELMPVLKQVMTTLHHTGEASPLDFKKTIQLAQQIATTLDVQQPSARKILPHFVATQALNQLKALFELQKHCPPEIKLTPTQLVHMFESSLKTDPSQFEKEIFAFPITQKSAVTPSQYQTLVHEMDPLRLALLLIRLKKETSTPLLTEFVSQVRETLEQGKSVVPLVRRYENKVGSTGYEVLENLASQGDYFLEEGLASVPQGAVRSLVLQALSPETGLLSSKAWSVNQFNWADVSLKGCLLMTQVFPAGLHRLEFKIKDEEGHEGFWDFLLFCVAGLSAEEEQKMNEASSGPESQGAASYDCIDVKRPLKPPLGGQVAIQLVSPYVLTKKYKEAAIPSPLQINFQFLMDVVDPQTLYSRHQFLTLAQSKEASLLRQSVGGLARLGVEAFNDYLKSLDALFAKIQSLIPQGNASFEKAKRFLRDEVLLYLMGKKQNLPTTSHRHVQLTNQGDLLAMVCQNTADVLAEGQQYSDALICFTDASRYAEHDSYFKQRLGDFFATLRSRMKPHGAQFGFANMRSNQKNHNQALVTQFLDHVRIVSTNEI